MVANSKEYSSVLKSVPGKRILGGIIGALVGLGFGAYFLSVAPSYLQGGFTLLALMMGSIGISITGAIGTTRNIVIQGVGAVIGSTLYCYISIFYMSIFGMVSDLPGGVTAFNVLFPLFLAVGVGLIAAYFGLFAGGILGFLFGALGTLIGRKADYGVFISALGTSFGAALGSFLVMIVLINFNI